MAFVGAKPSLLEAWSAALGLFKEGEKPHAPPDERTLTLANAALAARLRLLRPI